MIKKYTAKDYIKKFIEPFNRFMNTHGENQMNIQCPACKGTKQILKLGCIKDKCSHCDGKGYVAKESIDELKPGLTDSEPVNDDTLAKEDIKEAVDLTTLRPSPFAIANKEEDLPEGA